MTIQPNNTEQKKMNQEITHISNYQALLLAKVVLTLMLVFYFVFTVLQGKDSIAAFYLLLSTNMFPFLLAYITKTNTTKSRTKKSEQAQPSAILLPLTVKKYKYTRQLYTSNSMSFLLHCLFILLWYQRNLSSDRISLFLQYYPILVLIIILLLRTVGSLYYRFKIKRDLFFGTL